MLQIKELEIFHKKDLRKIISGFNLVLNNGDKAAIIGEEGNGKSSLIKWIYNSELIDDYADSKGTLICNGEVLSYLPQELTEHEKAMTVYEFFSENEIFYETSPRDLSKYASKFGLELDFFYSNQQMYTLSGGERVKACLIRILINHPTVLLLDEPSNDLDIDTLEVLEKIINDWNYIVLFVSHDETLIENTANVIIHMEQIHKKKDFVYSVCKNTYRDYIKDRSDKYEKQMQVANNERRAKKIRDEKLMRIYQSVGAAQDNVSRKNPGTARLLKKKMHTVKALERRYEREDKMMTEIPDQEDAIFFKLGERTEVLPANKVICKCNIDKLYSKDNKKVLSSNIEFEIRGSTKICIVGKNGCGKTTLINSIVSDLSKREDIVVEYMPQNYEDILDYSITPVDFLDHTGEKDNITQIRTFLGALKFTTDEMSHPIAELSGGQKAKVLLLKMSLSDANVLVLDEPTRNFSPLSGPVIRGLLKEFPGAIISVSHDRKYINEVCDKVYRLCSDGIYLLSD